jgi:hypothetical protein
MVWFRLNPIELVYVAHYMLLGVGPVDKMSVKREKSVDEADVIFLRQ